MRSKSKPFRSLIPDYYITDTPLPNDHNLTPKSKHNRNHKSRSRDKDPFSGPPPKLIVDTSIEDGVFALKVYSLETKAFFTCVVIILIMFAIMPVLILLYKKKHWNWIRKILHIKDKVMESPLPTYNIPSPVTNINAPPPLQSLSLHSIPINTTGGGIDITKPFVIDNNVHSQYMKLINDDLKDVSANNNNLTPS